MWSIYLKPGTILEGSEIHDLLQRFPQAANQDGENYIFVTTHENVNNPILSSDLVDKNGDNLTGVELAQEIKYQVLLDDRVRPIHLEKKDASRFYHLSEWRLWLGLEDIEDSTEKYALLYESTFPNAAKIERIEDRKAMRIATRVAARKELRQQNRIEMRKREREQERQESE